MAGIRDYVPENELEVYQRRDGGYMRALFVGSYPNPVEPHRSVFFRELIYQFARMGVECTVISPVSITKYREKIRNIPTEHTESLGGNVRVRVYRPHVLSFSAKQIGSWNTIKLTLACFDAAVLRKVEELGEQFDFVYGHFFVGGGLTAAKIARKHGWPAYIAYGECSYDSEVKRAYGDIRPEEMGGVRGIISVSSANSADLAKRKFAEGIPVLLSLNSVDKSVFHVKDKLECRKKLELPEKAFIVGFVGYFIARKGPERVLEACRDLPDVKLAFAGKGPQVPEGENVVFCRSLVHEEVADFLNAVDVFVLPTLHEGCCNAVIEAMSCGKPVISSDLPFNHDIMNGENSILVDPNNVPQIREAVVKLRDSEDLRGKLGEEALNAVEALRIENRARMILEFINSTRGMENG